MESSRAVSQAVYIPVEWSEYEPETSVRQGGCHGLRSVCCVAADIVNDLEVLSGPIRDASD